VERNILSKDDVQQGRFKHPELSYYLSILGMTGLTAYFGLMDMQTQGETVVVSGQLEP
jgi:NADPH-dependent curcumin reductase CurA